MSDISVMTLRENAIIKIKMGKMQGKTERDFFWLYSEKTGKTYDAEVILDDTGGKYVNFKLEFPVKKGRRK